MFRILTCLWGNVFISILLLKIRLLCCPARMSGRGSVSSPVLSVSQRGLLQTALVHIMPDVVHTPHYWSSFCTSHFHIHRLHCFIHLENVCIPVRMCAFQCKSGLPRFQCDVVHSQISPNFVASHSLWHRTDAGFVDLDSISSALFCHISIPCLLSTCPMLRLTYTRFLQCHS